MSLLNRLATAAAAAALIATPTLASAAAANPAATLSVAKAARTGAPAANKSKIASGPSATLVSIGILAALVVGVLVATDSDEDDSDSN